MNDVARHCWNPAQGRALDHVTKTSWLRVVMLSTALMLTAQVWTAPFGVGFAQDTACPEPNDDVTSACPLAANGTVRGIIDRPDDRDVYRLVVDTPGRFLVILTELPADYDLYATDAVGGVLGQSVHEGTAAEQVQFNVAAGTYFVVVQADPERQVDPSNPYTLQVAFAPTPTSSNSSAPPSAVNSVAPPSVANPATPSTGELRILAQDNFDNPAVGIMPKSSNSTEVSFGYNDGVSSQTGAGGGNGVAQQGARAS